MMITSFSDLIDRLGVADLAKCLGAESASTVGSWKARGSIPPEYWLEIIDLCHRRGLTDVSHEMLSRFAAEKKGRAALPCDTEVI